MEILANQKMFQKVENFGKGNPKKSSLFHLFLTTKFCIYEFLHQIKKCTHLLVMKKVGCWSSMRERLPDSVVGLPLTKFPF
jgi:hypothetical protein